MHFWSAAALFPIVSQMDPLFTPTRNWERDDEQRVTGLYADTKREPAMVGGHCAGIQQPALTYDCDIQLFK